MQQGTATTMNDDIEAQNDPLLSSITIRLAELSPEENGNACIYKIPRKLRDINEKCYIPNVVSLGPYTHGMTGLEFMENVKWRYMKAFQGWSGMSTENLIMFTREREAKARACYASLINFSSDEFVQIILVDTAFALTWLLAQRHRGLRKFSHFLEHGRISREHILSDFYLLENQLPLFLLQELFETATFSKNLNYSFTDLLRTFLMFDEHVSDGGICPEDMDSSQYRHLLGLRRELYKPGLRRELYKPSNSRLETSYIVRNPQSLTELHEAGVKFKLSSSKKLLDIQFNNGVLEIPHIKIDDVTETIFRNILAFEQCHGDLRNGQYITDYIVTMSYLVKTPRDAELLAQHGILQSLIGDNKQVSSLFYNLDKNIYHDDQTFYYAPLFEELDAHCQIRWKKCYASLKHEYFKNPWKITSIIAAGILLLLTLIQTVCSIISVSPS